LKIYTSTVEGLLLNNPAAILHKGQKLAVEHDTVDVLTAVTRSELVLADVITPAPAQTPKEPKPEEPEQTDKDEPGTDGQETGGQQKAGIRNKKPGRGR